jgi:hypothetical protein
MAQTTIVRQANGLVTQFVTNYTQHYGFQPELNRYREKWGFQDMIADLGYDRAKEIVDYYFRTTKSGHPVGFLLNNYDKINSFYSEKIADEKKREELRRETAERVKKWEEEHGEQRTGSN